MTYFNPIGIPPAQGYSRRTTPAFHAGPMGWEPDSPDSPTEGFNPIPLGGWVCYHCSERFFDPRQARTHFGEKPTNTPECLERTP